MKRRVSLTERDGAVHVRFAGYGTNKRSRGVLKRMLAEKLGDLTERQREALRLYYIEGMTQPQIAALWGIDKSAVSRHISRAKRRIELLVINRRI